VASIKHVFTSPIADGTNNQLVRPSDWNSAHLFTLLEAASLSGNTAGALALVSSGTLYLAGGNNITLSQNANSVTISGANTGGAQTGISGLQVSDTTYTSGTVSFRNANGISFGSSGAQGVSASYTVPTLTNSSMTISDAATSAGNVARLAFTNLNGVTLSLSTGAGGSHTIVGSYTVPTVTNSSWTVSDAATSLTLSRLAFTNVNGITLSLSTAAGAATVRGSYTVPTVTNSSMTVSDAATSGTLARLAFTNLNGVTLSLSTGAGGSHTIVGSHNALTSESIQYRAVTLGGATAGTTTFNASDGDTLFLAGSNGITLSGDTNRRIWFIGASQTNQSAIKGLGASNTGNTAGNTGVSTGVDWVIAGTNNVTVSESTVAGGPNTLWLSGGAGGAGMNVGVSTGGNTSGDTGIFTGQVVLAGGNAITLSGSSNAGSVTYTIQGRPVSIGVSTMGNTAGNTTVGAVGRYVLVGSNGITLSHDSAANSGTVTISGAGYTLSTYEPYYMLNTGTGGVSAPTSVSAKPTFIPYPVAAYVSAGAFQIIASLSFVTMGTSSGRQTATWGFGLFTRGTGANSTQLSQLTSTQIVLNVTYNNSTISISQPMTTNFTGYSISSTTSAGLNITSGYTGSKVVHVPVNTLLTPGNYWLGMVCAESTSSNSGGIKASFIGQVIPITNMAPIGSFSSDFSSGTNFAGVNNNNWYPALAIGSAATAALPASYPLSGMSSNVGIGPLCLRFWST
jgi:hypothetical protein